MATLNERLNNIDFVFVKKRLCQASQKGGFGWSLKDAESAIQIYVEFLKFVLDHVDTRLSGQPIFSNESRRLFEEAVEEQDRSIAAIVWEAHILNTRQYMEDCQRIFKCFLHYAPGLVCSDDVPT